MELRVSNLNKFYGKHQALKDVSITMNEGIYGLLGPNGAGKSTLINIIMKVIRQNSGEVFFNDINTKKLDETYYDDICYLPQSPQLYKNFTVHEFLEYICMLKGIMRSKECVSIKNAISLTGLKGEENKKIKHLSGGMKQRLGVAMGTLGNPKVLIFDEPTAGLDPIERIRFREMITSISKNKIVIIATHIISDVESIANEFILLKKGEIMINGSKEKIVQNVCKKDEHASSAKVEMNLEEALLYYYSS